MYNAHPVIMRVTTSAGHIITGIRITLCHMYIRDDRLICAALDLQGEFGDGKGNHYYMYGGSVINAS